MSEKARRLDHSGEGCLMRCSEESSTRTLAKLQDVGRRAVTLDTLQSTLIPYFMPSISGQGAHAAQVALRMWTLKYKAI